MTKAPNEKLGLVIKGGCDQPGANPHDPTDEGIFISKVGALFAIGAFFFKMS